MKSSTFPAAIAVETRGRAIVARVPVSFLAPGTIAVGVAPDRLHVSGRLVAGHTETAVHYATPSEPRFEREFPLGERVNPERAWARREGDELVIEAPFTEETDMPAGSRLGVDDVLVRVHEANLTEDGAPYRPFHLLPSASRRAWALTMVRPGDHEPIDVVLIGTFREGHVAIEVLQANDRMLSVADRRVLARALREWGRHASNLRGGLDACAIARALEEGQGGMKILTF